jgi:hypothetical protein
MRRLSKRNRLAISHVSRYYLEMLRFDWDEQKNKSNRIKHGIWFEEAQSVFSDRFEWLHIDSLRIREWFNVLDASVLAIPGAFLAALVNSFKPKRSGHVLARESGYCNRRLSEVVFLV